MTSTGHLHIRSGKKVKVHLKNGTTMIRKFKENTGNFVLFWDGPKIKTGLIQTLTIYKGKPGA